MKTFVAAMAGAVLLSSGAAQAGSVLEQFSGSTCYARTYDKAHLAAHPLQTVTKISLGRSPVQSVPGKTELRLSVQFLYRSEVFKGQAYCRPRGSGAACNIEADGGQLGLTFKSGELRMTADKVSLEGSDFVDFGRDDRVFLLRKGRCF